MEPEFQAEPFKVLSDPASGKKIGFPFCWGAYGITYDAGKVAPEKTETLSDCTSWCTVMLYIVPAKVDGTWKLPQGELALKQTYQTLAGTLTTGGKSVPVTGKLRGDQISWSANGQEYSGVVKSVWRIPDDWAIQSNRLLTTPSGTAA